MPSSKQQSEIDKRSRRAERVSHSIPPNELAAFAAHELRGPVNTLQAFLSILLREQPGPLNEIQRDFVSSMYVISRRLERFADDIQIMMAEGNGLSIEPRPMNPHLVVRECVREVTPIANSFSVNFKVNASHGADREVVLDPIRFAQIAVNLIENAARNAVEESTVQLTVKQSTTRILLIVENEAVELPPEKTLDDWFTPFVRGTTASERAPRGAGLGLTVVSHLVAALGGQILTRTLGHQVTIAVQLPRRSASEITIR